MVPKSLTQPVKLSEIRAVIVQGITSPTILPVNEGQRQLFCTFEQANDFKDYLKQCIPTAENLEIEDGADGIGQDWLSGIIYQGTIFSEPRYFVLRGSINNISFSVEIGRMIDKYQRPFDFVRNTVRPGSIFGDKIGYGVIKISEEAEPWIVFFWVQA